MYVVRKDGSVSGRTSGSSLSHTNVLGAGNKSDTLNLRVSPLLNL